MLESCERPWHRRIAPFRWLRGLVRNAAFSFAKKTLQTDDGKTILAVALDGLLRPSHALTAGDASFNVLPYPDLGNHHGQSPSQNGAGVIFITARFRSGSTLLWNLFRNLDGFTSYYEPFNERRWFDPESRGSRMDVSHRNVSDYWKEYDGLSILGQCFREEWNCRNLFMDSAAWDPHMKRYVGLLIERAPARPVLQFNRIDFRLPWFRQQFPAAKMVHLYRHPRDQWCSSLRDPRCFPKDGRTSDFARHDKFYLLAWARDLRYHFPFLEPKPKDHPYRLFYYIWKLSYLFGRKYAHYSLAFENLVCDPDLQLRELFLALDVAVDSPKGLKSLIANPSVGKWHEYAEEDWFRRHEQACEAVLSEWLEGLGSPKIAPSLSVGSGDRVGNGKTAPAIW